MAADVDVCNRALQKLGAKRISSIDEDSTNARACKAALPVLLAAELQSHRWCFSIRRFALAADAVAPEFGRRNSFTLPAEHLALLPPYPEMNSPYRDWVVEGNKIVTSEGSPLYVRCIILVTDYNLMHPLFREALASKMAVELCEELTQSNTKKADAKDDYKEAIAKAKRANAIESVPAKSPEDSWVTGRS